MIDDPLPAARLRLDRLLAERDQVRSRARAATSAAARQTYSCRMLELVDEVNAAIAAVDGLTAPTGSGVAQLDLTAELAALAQPAEG
ncbi:MAG TPA: hypothetical protein VN771_05030 [Candidatus Baltobacteraceae bacterium]|nr:hypothetical protein [Candidatus Baltobacteraceae bacterium]